MLGRARGEGSGGVAERLQDGSLLILACVQGAVQVVRTSWLRRHQGTLACGTLATLPAGRLAGHREPYAMQVESVNEYLFSLHLNSDLYAKLSLTQLALVYAHPYI